MRHQPNCNHDDDMENFIINTLKDVSKTDAKVYICGGSYSIKQIPNYVCN